MYPFKKQSMFYQISFYFNIKETCMADIMAGLTSIIQM